MLIHQYFDRTISILYFCKTIFEDYYFKYNVHFNKSETLGSNSNLGKSTCIFKKIICYNILQKKVGSQLKKNDPYTTCS